MKRFLSVATLLFTAAGLSACAQGRAQTAPTPKPSESRNNDQKIKPYNEVITKEAKSDSGLFIVHQVEDKWYYEIPREVLEREMLVVSRRAQTAANVGYGGEKNNTITVRWQHHNNHIYLRNVSYTNVADDSLPIYEAVRNANFEPIISGFDIAAFNTKVVDSTTTEVWVTVNGCSCDRPTVQNPATKTALSRGTVNHAHSGLPKARNTMKLTGPTRTTNSRMPSRSQGRAGTLAERPASAAPTRELNPPSS